MQDAPIFRFFNSLTIQDAFDVLKFFYLLAILLYTVFAVVMIRQVQHMVKALNGHFDLPLMMVALVHFGLAAGLFFLAFTIL